MGLGDSAFMQLHDEREQHIVRQSARGRAVPEDRIPLGDHAVGEMEFVCLQIHLFLQFTDKCLGWSLSSFDLATGETRSFIAEGEVMVDRPPESGQPETGGPSPVSKAHASCGLDDGQRALEITVATVPVASRYTHTGNEETNFGLAIPAGRGHCVAVVQPCNPTDLEDPHPLSGTDSQHPWIPITTRWRSQPPVP